MVSISTKARNVIFFQLLKFMMKTLGINLEMCKGTVYQSLFQAHMSGVGRTAFQ